MNKKAFTFVTTLGIMLVLTITGTLTTNMIINRTKGNKITKDAIIALRIAESGTEIALTKVKEGKDETEIDGIYNIIGGTAKIDYDPSNKTITSEGRYNEAKRKVVVNFDNKKDFYPFAINGKLTINNFQDTGSGNWTDAVIAAKKLDIPEEDFKNAGFDLITPSQLDLPKAADLNIVYPDQSECDYGNYNDNQTFTKDLSDQNSDDKIIVCGQNITLDDTLIKFNNNLTIAATANIYFTKGTTLKRDNTGPTVWLKLISGGKIYFEDNTNIDFAGADDGFNILIYSEQGIEGLDSTGQWLSISGNQNKENVSNVFIITPGNIIINRDLVDDTATTKKDVNFLIWADKGVGSENGGFDISGSSNTFRNFSIIVADGDAYFDKWSFSGSEERSGLTYEEIVKYCNNVDENGNSLGIPESFRQIYCQLKEQIDNAGNIKIVSWKTY